MAKLVGLGHVLKTGKTKSADTVDVQGKRKKAIRMTRSFWPEQLENRVATS